MIAVVDHLTSHPAVNADILARDEACHIRAEIQHHIGDIGWISNPAYRLLHGICAFVNAVIIVDSPGRDGIDPHLAGKTDRKRVRERRNTALCGCVALGLGLAHPVSGGRDVDDTCPFGKMRCEEFGKIKRRGHANLQSVFKILVTAILNAAHFGRGVVDEVVHVTKVGNHLCGKFLKRCFVRQIPYEIIVREQVDDAHRRARRLKLLADAPADAPRTARYNGDLIFEIEHII